MNSFDEMYESLFEDPLFFSQEIIGVEPWVKQQEIIKAVMNFDGTHYNRTSVKSCHGVGKTFISGNIALQFLMTYAPSIVVTTAPTFRQVEKGIWKEIRSSYGMAKIPLGGDLQKGTPNLQIEKDQWYAFGVSTKDGDKFQGLHEENILVIVDEAAGVSENIFEAIEGVLTSANAKLLLIGNPTSSSGTFRKSFEESGWNNITISAFDTPNFKHFGITESDIADGKWKRKVGTSELPYPKLITPEWVADKYKRWGKDSTLYLARILGQFSKYSADTLIPLSWIEVAIERNKECLEELETANRTEITIGVDVAEFGRDSSCMSIKRNRYIAPIKQFSKLPVMELTGHVVMLYNDLDADVVNVDTIGVGTGVEGRLAEQGVNTNRVNVAEAPGGNNEQEKAKFVNKRAQLYWNLRELLNPENENLIGLPDDEELTEELANTKYKIDSRGRIQIEPKEDIKTRIGRSPEVFPKSGHDFVWFFLRFRSFR